ncbi:hypothetical protein GCK72_025047 [Caenorhabditis remanei]|uniref:Uncharacterized protein n=1 Tax=Caenorhabditis remanei TaxID=31234 RepID=A0A6A5G0V0_CAERE|nr:hypothetical protein GCK72_025047 [Caenorhabditis remanei]KAF1748580.1 hypothetical protein GCK72_025047 [Caenorhabditis remanei]
MKKASIISMFSSLQQVGRIFITLEYLARSMMSFGNMKVGSEQVGALQQWHPQLLAHKCSFGNNFRRFGLDPHRDGISHQPKFMVSLV